MLRPVVSCWRGGSRFGLVGGQRGSWWCGKDEDYAIARRGFHPQLAPMVPHLNMGLLRLAKSKYESRMPEKLYSLLQDNLFLYYSYEEQLETDLSVEERRRLSLNKAKLSKFVDPFQSFCQKLIELKETAEMKDMIDDPEERRTIQELEQDLVNGIEQSEAEMFAELIKPPLAKETGVILEIRAGVGGEEAALFCKDLTLMYEAFATRQGWVYETLSLSDSEYGGYREVTAAIGGGGKSIHRS
jgi:protein subunit release factor A